LRRKETPEYLEKKTLGGKTRTSNKLNPQMTLGTGIEPGLHWWEASALTTAPSLLPSVQHHLLELLPLFSSRCGHSSWYQTWQNMVSVMACLAIEHLNNFDRFSLLRWPQVKKLHCKAS